MAHCDEYLELISASLDGALSPAEAEKLNAHLAQCPECRALSEELTALHAALSDLPPVEVPSGLTERIMAAVAAEQVLPFAPAEKKKSPLRWQRWLASAAVLAVVLMGTWSWKPWERQTANKAAPAAEAAQAPQMTDVVTEDLPEAAPQEQEESVSQITSALDQAESNLPIPTEEPSARSLPADNKISPKSAAGAAGAVPTPQPEPTPAPTEVAVAPRMAVRMEAPPLPSTAPAEGAEPVSTPEPALFSAPVPSLAPAENGAETPQAFTAVSNELAEADNETSQLLMSAADKPEETTAESQELTLQEALARVVEYIFEYSAPEDLTWETQEGEESLVCTIRWTDGGEEQTLVLHYFGPAEPLPEEYVFACPQEDLHPYAYLVDKHSGQVNVMCMD